MRRLLAGFGAVVVLTSCENGGQTRTLGVSASGVVLGQVYFDANGSRSFDATDAGFAGAGVRLLAPGGRDTLFRATTGPDGTFRLAGIPVGTYALLVDSSSAGDSARVVPVGPSLLTLLPDDSVTFLGAISYPVQTVAEARVLAPGRRLFVRAVALHARLTFSDTTLHVVDVSGALRAIRVRPGLPAVAAGDSVILRGTTGTRLGQRVLDDVTVFNLGPTFIPTAPVLTSQVAATGGTAGSYDAALVRVLNAAIIDTVTVVGDLHLTMNDGSGAVVMVLDRTADPAFNVPFPPGRFTVGNRFDITGVLVPTGTGAWRIKPRSNLDLTLR